MNAFKLLVVFILLLLGSFVHRFQRHLINGTENGYVNGNTEMDNLNDLSSDGDNYEQHSDYVKFVKNVREGIELELENKELMFKFCSDGCMDKVVIACFDSTDSNSMLRGDCGPGQCMFKAGVSKEKTYGTKLLWFMSHSLSKSIVNNEKICENATMMSPDAKVSFTNFPSCNPLKHDGNVVKLYVLQAPPGCPLYVKNAKKWTPPPTTTTSQNSSDLSETNQTTSKSSEANTTLWIVIGVGIFILLIVTIGFGYCCYRTQIQKKPLFGKEKDDQRKANILEASNKAIFAENEKNADEKQVLKLEKVVAKPEPSKESTVAKEKQPKPTKKKAPVVVPKPSKEITQENGTKEDAQPQKKVSIEPTLENPTTEKSVVQQKQQPGNPSRASVSKKVILPAMNSDGFKSVSLFDTLSGAEDDETQHSTHASEKPRKNESAARKKGSKKRR